GERRVAACKCVAHGCGGSAQRIDRCLHAEARFRRANHRPLTQLLDRRNGSEIGHRRTAPLQDGCNPQSCNSAILCHTRMNPDPPKTRPLERFWPYADLPEQPTEEELAALDPDLHEALFGARPRPFSITLVFPTLDQADFGRALELARGSAEYRETGSGATLRHRARFWSSDAARLRALFEL